MAPGYCLTDFYLTSLQVHPLWIILEILPNTAVKSAGLLFSPSQPELTGNEQNGKIIQFWQYLINRRYPLRESYLFTVTSLRQGLGCALSCCGISARCIRRKRHQINWLHRLLCEREFWKHGFLSSDDNTFTELQKSVDKDFVKR